MPQTYQIFLPLSALTFKKHCQWIAEDSSRVRLQAPCWSVFQSSDAPAAPAIDQLNDSHRVFPGNGILPLPEVLRDLRPTGFGKGASLELYNAKYWIQALQQVKETG